LYNWVGSAEIPTRVAALFLIAAPAAYFGGAIFLTYAVRFNVPSVSKATSAPTTKPERIRAVAATMRAGSPQQASMYRWADREEIKEAKRQLGEKS